MKATRKLAFALLVIACVAAIVISILVARRGYRDPIVSPSGLSVEHAGNVPGDAAALSDASGAVRDPHARQSSPIQISPVHAPKPEKNLKSSSVAAHPALVYFRANALGPNYGKLAVADINELSRISYANDLSCERVHFSAGVGICLVADLGVFSSYYAVKFDERMQHGWKIKLNGAPSRVRVSPSGRLAAITVFLPGSSHSYSAGTLSTQTTIVDVASGAVLTDLEQFAVTRDGKPYKSPDFNFWGVTFTKDENRFYATLWSKDKTYLVYANLAERSAKVVHDGVECPSISPDNRLIAFKKRMSQTPPYLWRIALLDLQSGKETLVGETRNVDDQVEWLDNQHILYAISAGSAGQSSASTNIWVLPITADGAPKLMLQAGASPAIVASEDGARVRQQLATGNKE